LNGLLNISRNLAFISGCFDSLSMIICCYCLKANTPLFEYYAYDKDAILASLRKKSSELTNLITPDVLQCHSCKTDLSEVQPSQLICRQELDIPPGKPEITENQMASKICPNCKSTTTAQGPENLTQPIQFGVNIIALVTYLNQGQLVPLNRVQEMLMEMFSIPISEGTLVNMIKKAYTQLEDTELQLHKDLLEGPVSHTDETSIYVNGETWWWHVFSNAVTTCFFVHRKRGKEAMDAFGLLGKYIGTVIHDHFSPYFLYLNIRHALCNAHHIRELRSVAEDYNQLWCQKMRQFLLDANITVENYKKDGKTELSAELLKEYSEKYDAILAEGLSQIPEDPLPEIPKKRGRKKQHKAKNLHDRLSKRKKEVLLFMFDFEVPFTNNQAERDLRMVKLRQKISGCFRSPEGAQYFSRIRGYISTCRKRNINIMQALVDLARGQPNINI
jgi:transposase